MNLDQIIRRRRSVRAYQDRPLDPQDLQALLQAARRAPSACNSQTWRFVVVTDKSLINRLCHEAMRAVIPNRWLAQAPAVIVGCSRLDLVSNRIGSRITGIEYYKIDLGIAMEHMVLKATELGLGTCWIGWFKVRQVQSILKIPPRVKVSAMLTVGYAADSPPSRSQRKPLNRIAYLDHWGQPFSSG